VDAQRNNTTTTQDNKDAPILPSKQDSTIMDDHMSIIFFMAMMK
jgi:hypothetical protein